MPLFTKKKYQEEILCKEAKLKLESIETREVSYDLLTLCGHNPDCENTILFAKLIKFKSEEEIQLFKDIIKVLFPSIFEKAELRHKFSNLKINEWQVLFLSEDTSGDYYEVYYDTISLKSIKNSIKTILDELPEC